MNWRIWDFLGIFDIKTHMKRRHKTKTNKTFRRQGILHIEMPAYDNIPYPHASYLSYICCHGVLIKFEQIGLCLCCQDKDGTIFCVDANAGSFGTNLCGQELVSTASAEMVKGTPDGSLLRSITRTKKDIGLWNSCPYGMVLRLCNQDRIRPYCCDNASTEQSTNTSCGGCFTTLQIS